MNREKNGRYLQVLFQQIKGLICFLGSRRGEWMCVLELDYSTAIELGCSGRDLRDWTQIFHHGPYLEAKQCNT